MITSVRQYLASLLLLLLGTTLVEAGDPVEGAGNYGGVIEPSLSDPPERSGLIQLQLGPLGNTSGVLIWQGARYPFKGRLSVDTSLQLSFAKQFSRDPVKIRAILNLSGGSRIIFGTLAETLNGLVLFNVPINLSGALPDPVIIEKLRPGLRISFIDPPDFTNEGEVLPIVGPEPGPAVSEITGDGFVHVRVAKSKKRATRMIGRLPDAAGVFTAGSPLRGSSYTVFSSLYKKLGLQRGQLFGDASVFDSGDQPPDLVSTLRWGKLADFGTAYYPQAIDRIISLDAVPYPRRRNLVTILSAPSALQLAPLGVGPEPTQSITASMLFRRGNITLPDGAGGFNRFFRQTIKITPFHTRVAGDNPHQVKIHVDAFSGRFRGSFMHPVLNARTKFRGAFQPAFLLTPGQGRGHFRPPMGPGIAPLAEPPESGGVRINPN